MVAVEDPSCGLPLLTTVEDRVASLRVTVEGVGPSEPVQCAAIIPPSALIGLEAETSLALEVVHAGATDLYRADLEGAPSLTAVRTTTTRLAR